MKRIAALALFPLLACAGAQPASTSPAASASWDAAAYRATIDDALSAYFAADPPSGSRAGMHAYDAKLPDLSEAGEARIAADFRARAAALRALASRAPSKADPKVAGTDRPELDARVLADRFEVRAYDLDTIRAAERDPSGVLSVLGTAMVTVVDHEYAPKRDRMSALASRLEGAPAMLDAARARAKTPTRASLENLVVVGKGLPAMLRGPAVAEWQKGLEADKALQDRLAKAASGAANAIDAYVAAILASHPIDQAKDVPIGAERWATLARLHEGVTESPAEVRKMGEQEIARLDAELDALIATSGQKGETRKAFFTRLESDTPKPDGVLDEYRASEKRVEQWMHEHVVVDVPWDKATLAIAPTPPHMRGISFASMNVAGVLDSVSDARFQVTEPNPAMPPEQQQALLHFHAHGALDMVGVHEAIPGHYLQYLFLRDVPSQVRRLGWYASFGEGWAHYCEQMALENGFGGGDPRMHGFYIRMALQRAARVVVDVAENDGSMSLAEGAKFLEDNAMLAPESAKIEARRAVVWPANMFTYTYGKLAILKMRDAVKAKEGAAFDLRKFHDRLLSVGAMPVKTVGQVAFGDELDTTLSTSR